MGWKKYKPKGYYRTCPLCGASLDPGEICDCGVSEYVFSGEEVVPERLPKREAMAIIPPVKLPEKPEEALGPSEPQKSEPKE